MVLDFEEARVALGLPRVSIDHGEDEYRVPLLDPAVAARLAMIRELTIPTLMFLGLATRFATVPLLGMITVIQIFVYPNAYNDHLV